MIQSLLIENLKCFESLRLDLAPLTLLTGFNAAGKSTTLQTLQLLAQTLRSQRGTTELRLNGSMASLGTPSDILNNSSGAKRLKLGVENSDIQLVWEFELEEEIRRSLRVSKLAIKGKQTEILTAKDLDGIEPRVESGAVKTLINGLKKTIFLSAARQVETDVFPVPLEMAERRGDVGVIGQFAAWWLYSEGDTPVAQSRCIGEPHDSTTLRHQINAWCEELFPGVELNALPVPKTSLMRLELRSGPTVDWSSPANIGYGVSYAFPVLVAGLCAIDDYPLILDSPEAHLHPKGQSRIGGFLAQMAAAGSQILVETHSDHLLNGVRLALKDGVIDPSDVAIYFFSPLSGSRVTRLSVDKNGTVSDWPPGFFDQSEMDLANLAGWT